MDWEYLMSGISKGNPSDPGSSVTSIDGKEVDSPPQNVDADTIKNGDQRYRIKGMNAPETAKVHGGVFIPGQVAGDTTQAEVNQLGKIGGFTKGVTEGKDVHGRPVLDIQNEVGQSLGDTATALGITDINQYSSDKAVNSRQIIDSLQFLMPSLGQSNPAIKMARESFEERVKKNGGNPLFIPKAQVANEQQYSAIKNAIGTKAMSEAFKEMDRIEGLLQDPNLGPETRDKLNKMLEKARDDAFVAGTLPDFIGGVEVRAKDRSMMNKAYNQLGTTWANAILDVKKQTYGFLEIAGDQAKWEWLADVGRAGVIKQQAAQGMLPETLSTFKDVPGHDTWSTITNAATYAGNLITGTIPMMAVIMGSSMVTGGMAGGAILSTIPASLLYTGGYYADQPDDKKNAALAWGAGIGSAVLDKAGLEGMMGGNLFSAAGRKEIIANMRKLPQYKDLADDALDAKLKEMTKAEILSTATHQAEFAAKQYASKEAMINGMRSIGVATASEGMTESSQQLLEMMAKSGEFDPDMRYEKGFYDALIDAAVGGGLMGGGFRSVGTAFEAAQWANAADARKAYEGNLADAVAYRAHQRAMAEGGAAAGTVEGAQNVLDGIAKLKDITYTPEIQGDLQSMTGKPGYWNGFMSVVRDPLSFYRQLANTTVKSLRKNDGSFKQYMPLLKSLMANGTLPGDSFDGFRQRIIGELHTPDIDQVASAIGTNAREVNRLLRKAWQETWSKKERLDVSDPTNNALQVWKDEADAAVAKVKTLLDGLHYDTSSMDTDDSPFIDATIDFKHILANEHRIVAAMREAGIEGRQARESVADITSGDRLRMKTAKDQFRRAGIFHRADLNDLFEPNIVEAFENYKHHLSNRVASDIYLGENGSNLAKLLKLAAQNGEFESEYDYQQTVQNVKDWYEITQGTFRSLEKYPHIERIVGWGVTATMLASLGKAAFSSIPEIAMSTLGTPAKDVLPQLKSAASTLVREIQSDLNKGVSFAVSGIGVNYARNTPHKSAGKVWEKLMEQHEKLATNPDTTQEQWDAHAKAVKKFHKKYIGRSLFERLGFNDSGYNSQARFETNTSNMKNTMRIFSAFIGLRAMTDATRIASLSVSADILHGKLQELMAIPESERYAQFSRAENMTVGQYQALKELESWGMDVPKVLNIMSLINKGDPKHLEDIMFSLTIGKPIDLNDAISSKFADEQVMAEHSPDEVVNTLEAAVKDLETEVMTTIRNMTNERVIHPNTANMPKYYHDPRLRVLTTMTRFIGAMTAVVLPRLYKNYIRDGSMGMRYQAFTTIAMSVFFAHFANMLKDVLSYGDDDNPYLKSPYKRAQRDIYASGVLGKVESLIDAAMPLYDNRKPDPTERPFSWAYQNIKDSAPPVSWADKAVRAMYNIGAGNTQQGVKQAVRAAPLIGSYPIAADVISKQFKE